MNIRKLSTQCVIGVVAGFGLLAPMPARAIEDPTLARYTTQTEQIAPEQASALAPATPLTAAAREKLQLGILARREALAAKVDNNPPAPAGLPLTPGQATQVGSVTESEVHGTPSAFVLGRNNQNANARGGLGSTLAEPTAVNDGVEVFYTGNTHAEFSTNGGVSYTNVPIPAGPADAPFVCCDLDTVHDQSRGLTLWIALYTNAAQTNGVIRLFVRRTISSATCSYLIDPAGAANNILPDYPHLGISNDFLYLTTNNLPTVGAATAQVRRISLDSLVDCVGIGITTFSIAPAVGQRVFVPVNGAQETK